MVFPKAEAGELAAVCRPQHGKELLLRREHAGRKAVPRADRPGTNPTSSVCPRRGSYLPRLAGKLPRPRERAGQRSKLIRRQPNSSATKDLLSLRLQYWFPSLRWQRQVASRLGLSIPDMLARSFGRWHRSTFAGFAAPDVFPV